MAKAGKRVDGKTILQLVSGVEASREFLEWRKANKAAYLSSAFTMADGAGQLGKMKSGEAWQQGEWLLSYYDRADDTFTTFSSAGSRLATKEEAFKKGETLPQLDAEKAKVPVWECIRKANAIVEKRYKGQEASKIIAILQPLTHAEISGSEEKTKSVQSAAATPVWNITYITSSFSVINMKIDAATGDVRSHRMSGVMDFAQKDA